MALYGAVEGGGTKFVCAVGSGPSDRLATARIPTTTPAETLPRVRRFLLDAAEQAGQALTAIGIATFGPIELDRQSPRYGYMLPTPKPGWSGAPVVAAITAGLDVPVAVDTDVNGAALAEYRWGAAQGYDPALYVTVGTGIGGGVIIGGTPLHGLLHPEMGHIAVPRARDAAGNRDEFAGICPFHGDCMEGMAAGGALAARVGRSADDLAPDDPVWELGGALSGGGAGTARACALATADCARRRRAATRASAPPYPRCFAGAATILYRAAAGGCGREQLRRGAALWGRGGIGGRVCAGDVGRRRRVTP